MLAHNHLAIDVANQLHHVVMVVPVDGDVSEADHVADEDRPLLQLAVPAFFVGRLQLQHHDRDDHRNHAVGEALSRSFSIPFPQLRQVADARGTIVPEVSVLPTHPFDTTPFQRARYRQR
jgi:hypothetical protein